MDTTIFFGIILGVCLCLLILFTVRDIIFKHYVDIIMNSVQVQPVMNPEKLISTISSYVGVLEATSGLFSELLSENILKDENDIKTLTYTRDSVDKNIKMLNSLITDLEGVFPNGRN